MQNLETITRLVCQVAREAGAYIRKEREAFSPERVERKHAHDYVSYVDKGSEQLIVSRLRQLLPDAGFITEEGTALTSPSLGGGQGEVLWVVDPLDGTTNFIHGFAPYAVSIALMQDDAILLGVVYDVASSELFYAWQGGGAWSEKWSDGENETMSRGAVPLRVSRSGIDDALLCLQLPYNSDAYRPVIQQLINRFYGRVASIRMMGSAAIALCWVAAGRLDGYAERYIGQWDYMAGALIVAEAGGLVTDYAGSPRFHHGDSVVAANPLVHPHLLEADGVGGRLLVNRLVD